MALARRLATFCALASVALLLGGCVYLRLLELKHQLGDFDRNFAVETADGLTLTFKNPVLLDEDVEDFFKWRPDTRQRANTAERWTFRWIKERMPADGLRPPVELSVEATFVDHKLVKLHASESFFAASMPKSIALAALKSLGHAKVNKGERRADSTLDAADLQAAATERFLTEEGVISALGQPVAHAGTIELPQWIYRFNPASTHQRLGGNGVVDVTFTFDPATKKVLLMKGTTAFGVVAFDTRHTTGDAKGSVSAKLQ